jgi:DNA invertase Pin-like site-specific DNA recombinase
MSSKTTAYSYVRFSSPEQAKGDSLRRQTELAAAYCKRRGWRLDDTLTLRDLGVSSFRGENALVGNLGEFLKAVARKTIRPGSVLIVESIDRISRQGIDEGYDVIKRILKAGVVLVTLAPEREFGVEAVKSLSKGALEIMLILERAAEESEMKAHRSREAWADKRKAAAEKGGIITRRLPAWVADRNGRLELIPDKAQAVRRIFDLAIAGYGTLRIVKRLQEDGVPPLSGGDHWSRSYVALILRDRRAAGEFRPRDRNRKVAGEAIADYYPAVVSRDEFDLARDGVVHDRRRPGRVGACVNLFAGLLRDARDGGAYYAVSRPNKGFPSRVLLNVSAKEGRQPCFAFPLKSFEDAVRSLLRELDVHALLNGDAGPDESTALAAEKARVEARIAALERELLEGDVATAVRALRVLEAQKRDLGEQLDAARHRAVHPLSETWGEAKGLLDALPETDEKRTRIRTVLRSLIAEAWVLVVPVRGSKDRLCALQLFFNTDTPGKQRRRDYLIHNRPARNNGTQAVWRCWSLAAVVREGDLDLRDRGHAARLEKVLAALDLPDSGR